MSDKGLVKLLRVGRWNAEVIEVKIGNKFITHNGVRYTRNTHANCESVAFRHDNFNITRLYPLDSVYAQKRVKLSEYNGMCDSIQKDVSIKKLPHELVESIFNLIKDHKEKIGVE